MSAGVLAREGELRPAAAKGFSASEIGTFKDNKAAPIHRWFQYPAGFSFHAVERALDTFAIGPGRTVLDPFAGAGTTLVACKGRGVASVGTEAHPLVARIARTKVAWEVDIERLRQAERSFLDRLPDGAIPRPHPTERPPALLRACFARGNLAKLLWVREQLPKVPRDLRGYFEVALIGTLRVASRAATGWPYIAPRKRIAGAEAFSSFRDQLHRIVEDLSAVPTGCREVRADVLDGDARDPPVPHGSVDLAFTSPPYLNNYDYADRMRLETYFMGLASSWGEISRRFRSRLVVSATTQVLRGDGPPARLLEERLGPIDPGVTRELVGIVEELGRRRRTRSGAKSYDLMVAGYFCDMARVLAATRERLRPGASFVLILGDSAPYGVPVRTEDILGRLGRALGYRASDATPLRARGGKWRSNPQRHHVPLRESWLVLRT